MIQTVVRVFGSCWRRDRTDLQLPPGWFVQQEACEDTLRWFNVSLLFATWWWCVLIWQLFRHFWCHIIVRSFAETYIILQLLIGMSSTMSREIRYCETVGRILKIRHNKRTSTQMMNTTNQGRVMKVNDGSNKRTSTQMMNTTNQRRVIRVSCQDGCAQRSEMYW